ncbi:hypothetical protein, partial [Nonomuraea sp. B19D2]|uniref:hypothetical protein n=1 Tax=Nonomuraea sp. B19D2 TaxID=3159561 RepID=UPI0032DABB5D
MAAFFTEFGKAGFQADPIFLRSDEEHVVDVHRGWTTREASARWTPCGRWCDAGGLGHAAERPEIGLWIKVCEAIGDRPEPRELWGSSGSLTIQPGGFTALERVLVG